MLDVNSFNVKLQTYMTVYAIQTIKFRCSDHCSTSAPSKTQQQIPTNTLLPSGKAAENRARQQHLPEEIDHITGDIFGSILHAKQLRCTHRFHSGMSFKLT